MYLNKLWKFKDPIIGFIFDRIIVKTWAIKYQNNSFQADLSCYLSEANCLDSSSG